MLTKIEDAVISAVESMGWKFEKARENDKKGMVDGVVKAVGVPLLQELMEDGYGSDILEDLDFEKYLDEFIEKKYLDKSPFSTK